MKKLVNSIFPYFDTKALDAARFFFGTTAADVALYPGRMNLTEYLNEDIFDKDMPEGQYDGATIPEGSRNATMSRFAGKVIKKYGDSNTVIRHFWKKQINAIRHWMPLNLPLSGTVRSAFTLVFSSRMVMLHRSSTTILPVINRRITPM